MRKWILMLVCVLTLSALSVCFAEDSDNSGEVTAQQSYVNEAITVTSGRALTIPSAEGCCLYDSRRQAADYQTV